MKIKMETTFLIPFNLDQKIFDNSKINLKLEKVSNDTLQKYIH